MSETEGNCPIGHYCPEETRDPVPCGAGTYNDIEGMSNEEAHCKFCEPGYYCPGEWSYYGSYYGNHTPYLISECCVNLVTVLSQAYFYCNNYSK